MYGFRRFSSYKKTVVAVKLLKKLVQKVGGMGVLKVLYIVSGYISD